MADRKVSRQPVSVAVPEKLACHRTAAQFLQARAQGGSARRALEILAKSGADISEVCSNSVSITINLGAACARICWAIGLNSS